MVAHSTILVRTKGGIVKEMTIPIAKALKQREVLEHMAGSSPLVGAARVEVVGDVLDVAREIEPCVAELEALQEEYQELQDAFEAARREAAMAEMSRLAAQAIILLRKTRDSVRKVSSDHRRRRASR